MKKCYRCDEKATHGIMCERHSSLHRKYCRAYREKNAEAFRERGRKYYRENRDEIRAKYKERVSPVYYQKKQDLKNMNPQELLSHVGWYEEKRQEQRKRRNEVAKKLLMSLKEDIEKLRKEVSKNV
jgi:hypothetical protein